MTTKPKATRFRIKRNGAQAGAAGREAPTTAAPVGEAPEAAPAAAVETPRTRRRARPEESAPKAESAAPAAEAAAPVSGDVATPAEAVGETDLEAIRQEGLTGRQLRMARRVAQRHGLLVHLVGNTCHVRL